MVAMAAMAAGSAACGEGSGVGPEPPEAFVYSAVAAGAEHTCGLAPTGVVYCWGRGDRSALGTGSAESSPVPVRTGPDRVVLDIAAGFAHTCAVTIDGEVHCWGWNRYGQVGARDQSDQGTAVTVDVPTTLGIAVVTAGARHSCALDQAGQAFCWGANGQGQLGDGTTTDAPRPVAVATEERFVAISAGAEHTCAVTLDGRGRCWGLNHRGQLGTGTIASATTPTPVAGDRRWGRISAGYDHSCGVADTGAILCWGGNESGQLGTGAVSETGQPGSLTPHPIVRPSAGTQVSAGYGFSCAVSTFNAAFCWGRGDSHQLGIGRFEDFTVPHQIMDRDIAFAAVSAGGLTHACAVSRHGGAYCWGTGHWGQLGSEATRVSPVPIRVSGGLRR
jgi:alpha-tubulin suppressor-like RCC1 family protein